jgi:hypothetical protein
MMLRLVPAGLLQNSNVYLEMDSSSDQEVLWVTWVPAGHEHVSRVNDGGVLPPTGLFDRCYATQAILAVPAVAQASMCATSVWFMSWHASGATRLRDAC